jgi:hypothetical protein
MKRVYAVLIITTFIVACSLSYAGQGAGDILREGLLGAGAGAVGGAASGADSDDLWKGALAGAGVNIVGGALLDAITGEQVNTVQQVQTMNPQDAYGNGYSEGFNNGFKQGYMEGYKTGLKEAVNP